VTFADFGHTILFKPFYFHAHTNVLINWRSNRFTLSVRDAGTNLDIYVFIETFR